MEKLNTCQLFNENQGLQNFFMAFMLLDHLTFKLESPLIFLNFHDNFLKIVVFRVKI